MVILGRWPLEPPTSLNGVAQFGSAIALDEHTAVVARRAGQHQFGLHSRVQGGAGAWRYTAKLDPCMKPATLLAVPSRWIATNFRRLAQERTLSAGNAEMTLFERGAKWTLQREVPDDGTHRLAVPWRWW
jgi:hypothetical protein